MTVKTYPVSMEVNALTCSMLMSVNVKRELDLRENIVKKVSKRQIIYVSVHSEECYISSLIQIIYVSVHSEQCFMIQSV